MRRVREQGGLTCGAASADSLAHEQIQRHDSVLSSSEVLDIDFLKRLA